MSSKLTAERHSRQSGSQHQMNIPGLALALMHVVHAVEKMILIVPAECAEQHAKVQPGIADSLNIFIQHRQKRMWLLVQIVQVPGAYGTCWLLKACTVPADRVHTEDCLLCEMLVVKTHWYQAHNQANLLLGVKIIGIINSDFLLRNSFNNTPATASHIGTVLLCTTTSAVTQLYQ